MEAVVSPHHPGDPAFQNWGLGFGLDGAGESSPGEPVFFPARPRLIVPPALEDLKIKSLRVSLKILVSERRFTASLPW